MQNRIVFGIHCITPYRRSDELFYGMLEVIGGANLELSGESEDLYGGSSRFAYASNPTQVSSQMTCNVKSYPNFLMELFLGGTVTSVAAAAAGETRDYANVKGSSVKHASTGIASIGLITSDKGDLKFGHYVIVATDTDEVDVYLSTNIDFNRGNAGEYLTDALKIAEGLSVTSGGDTNLANYGIKLVGGGGTIALVAGDTASFDVYPPHSGISHIDVGSPTSEFPEFGAFLLASKSGSKEIFQIRAYKCQGAGMPMPMQEKAYMISDLNVKLLQDSTLGKVFRITHATEVE